MNRIFRSVWSEVTRTYVAAAETVKRSSPSAGVTSAVDVPALLPSGSPAAALRRISRPRPMLLALEARLMFDGAAVETVASAAGAASMFDRPVDTVFAPAAIAAREAGASTTPLAAANVLPAAVAEEAPVTDGAARLEVMFVDSSVANYESLLAGARPGVEVVVLDASRDGLAQVAEYLKGRSGIDSIHLMAHGSAGHFALGSTDINAAAVGARQAELAAIGSALSADGDILIYACDSGAGLSGQSLVLALAAATGADVAASGDATGAAARGGNWALETRAGAIEATLPLTSQARDAYTALMAAPTINNLGGDSVAWVSGGTVKLDAGTAVTVSDSGLGNDWNGASLTVQRVTGGVADATANDLFTFNPVGFTVSGSDLQSGGQTFATFTNTGGVLTITFSSSATPATTALVQSVMGNILYANATPYGNATIRFSLNNGSAASTADVTVTSATIYADSTTDTDSEGDATDGFSLREALARSVSQAGVDTIKLVLADNSSYTFGSNVTVGAGDTLNLDGANGVTIAGSTITLGGTLTVSNGAGTSASIASVLAGSAKALAKDGAGTLTLTGTNTYSGTTTIFAGELQIGNGGTTGALSSSSAITNQGRLVVNRSDDINMSAMTGTGSLTKLGAGMLSLSGNFNHSGGTTILAGTLQISRGGTVGSISGDITNNAALVFNRANDISYAGVISGTGTVTKRGGGTLTFTGNNTYTGGTIISAGTLQLGNNSATGSIVGDVTNNAALSFSRNDAVTFAGAISGTGRLTKLAASGTLTLTGDNTYTGGTIINSGILQIGNGGTTGSVAGTITNHAQLVVNRSDDLTLGGAITGAGSLTKSGAGTLTLTASNTYFGGTTILAGALQIGNGSTTGTITGNIANEAALIVNRTGNLNYAGIISGTGTVTKLGAGTFTISGANTYTGGTTISAGLVQVGTGGTIGSIVGDVTNNGSISFARSDVVTFAGVISGTGSLENSSTGTLKLTGANTYTGGTTISAGLVQVGSGGTTGSIVGDVTNNGSISFARSDVVTFAGVISGTGSLENSSTGTLKLTGASTYTGGTSIANGTLQIGDGGTTGSIVGNVTSSGTHALTFNRSDDLTFAGVISGPLAVTQAGAGTLTLSGTNTYTSSTTVSAGTLQVTGALSGTSGITVASGATLGGTGSLFASNSTNTLTVSSGATLSPGVAGSNGGVGSLTVNGNLAMAAGSTLAVDIAGNTAGSGYDQLVVKGSVDVSGATLSAAHRYSAAYGDSYVLIDNDGSDAITGTLAGLAEGASLTANGTVLDVSYVGGSDNNDIKLTPQVNAGPVIGNLSGDRVAWAGVGNYVTLDAGTAVTVSDPEFGALNGGNGNWNGATLTLNRVTSGGAADGTSKDLFKFLANSTFALGGDGSIAYAGYPEQSIEEAQAKGQNATGVLVNSATTGWFARWSYTYATGTLVIQFGDSASGNPDVNETPTTALVQAVLQSIAYRNDTPYGDTTLRVTLSDGAATGSADVTVASSTIYANSTADTDSQGDAADGFSLREALARSVSQAGADTIRVVLADNSSYTLASGATVGGGDTLNLDGANGLTISGGTLTLGGSLTVSNAAAKTATISSEIAGSGQALTKDGAGTLSLSGSNSYTGATTVAAGTLSVTGALSGTSGVTVASGASLGGTGSIFAANSGNMLTVQSGATLAPGVAGLNNSIGKLTVNGGLTLAAGGILAVDIKGGSTAGSDYDQVDVLGSVTVSGATITPTLSYSPSSGTSHILINNDASDSITGTFGGLAQGATLTSAGTPVALTASYIGGSNSNDFTLALVEVTPPPSVSAITRVNTAASNASSVQYTVRFSESVSGVDLSDFSLSSAGTVSGSIASVSGSGDTYTVTVSGITGDGTLRLDLNSAGTGILGASKQAIEAGYTGGEAYTFDHSAPSAPSAPDLASGSDTGVSNADNITSTATPVFTGTAEANATVRLYDTDGTTLLGTATADASGHWSITSSTLSDGVHAITARATDAAGNVSAASAATSVSINATAPTLAAAITLSDTALKLGDTATVTFSFSEAVSGFTVADVSVSNGVLSNLTSSDGGITWTATLTPNADTTAARNGLTLDHSGIADLAGNAGSGSSRSDNYTVDTVRPALASHITIADTALKLGDTATVTFSFSEAVSGFTVADVSVPNGVLSDLTSSDGGITWTATLTPNADTTAASNALTLDHSGIADLAGNAGSGTSSSGNYAIDSQAPAVDISVSAASLSLGGTATVTFSFSEDPGASFTWDGSAGDVVVEGGTLSAISGSGLTRNAIFTPTPGLNDGRASITVAKGAYLDAAGNAGRSGAAPSISFDTARPTASIVVASGELLSGTTSLVTVSFSEAVTGLSNADLTVTGGSLNPLRSADGGRTWTATFSPTEGLISVGNTITLNSAAIADAAGNRGVGTVRSNSYAVNTLPIAPPRVEVAPPPAAAGGPASSAAAVMLAPHNPVAAVAGGLVAETAAASGQTLAGPASFAVPASATADGGGFAPGALNPTEPTLTRATPSAFPVSVLPADQAGLRIVKPLADQSLARAGAAFSFTIPTDAFAHSEASALIQLSAKLSNGQALPAWLKFDPASGTFTGQPPAELGEPLSISVTARDADGREVTTVFRLTPQGLAGELEPSSAPETEAAKQPLKSKRLPVGRMGFSDQLRAAGRLTAAAERAPAMTLRG